MMSITQSLNSPSVVGNSEASPANIMPLRISSACLSLAIILLWACSWPTASLAAASSGDMQDQFMRAETEICITAGERSLTARLADSPAVRRLLEMLPLDVQMEDLYSRELCYHLGAGALPTAAVRDDAYEVGDIIYWPPMGSLVILYAQNGEQFSRVHLGHITDDVSFFSNAGTQQVRWEALP